MRRFLGLLAALAVVVSGLVLIGRLTNTAVLRGHLEAHNAVEVSLTFNKGCESNVFYVLLGAREVTSRHFLGTRCA